MKDSSKQSESGTYKTENTGSGQAFKTVIVWSGIIFICLLFLGLIYRLVMPVQLHLEESAYVEKVFTLERTETRTGPEKEADSIGYYEAGSVLYIIRIEEDVALVRPLMMSELDSVWINQENLVIFEEEVYRDWLKEQDYREVLGE